MTLPTVKQVRSPNFTPTPIRHDLVIVHRMEGGYAGSVAWLCDPDAKASAHLCMKADGSEVTQLVPLDKKAWAQCAFNSAGVSLEIEGYSAQGMSLQTELAAAQIVAWLCRVYAIPPSWAEGGRGRGVCQHHDLGMGGGGHVDCFGVGSLDWQRFMAAVRAAYDGFAGNLPVWALNGSPGPHEVSTAPFVPLEPSHGGAQRNEPGDVIRHPTASGYPSHSVTGLQADLNAIADAGLDVDGGFGPLTVRALETFQASHGLVIDGVPGPSTWAALDMAMAKAAEPASRALALASPWVRAVDARP